MELVDMHNRSDPNSGVIVPEQLKPNFALYRQQRIMHFL
jgi:hypothetical protein